MILEILLPLAIAMGISYIFLNFTNFYLPSLIKNWFWDRIEDSKTKFNRMCFKLSNSSVDIFVLEAPILGLHRGWIRAYIFDSEENLKQKQRLSCYFWAFGDKRFKEWKDPPALLSSLVKLSIDFPDPKLANALNSDRELLEAMGKRLHLLTVYFGEYYNPVEKSQQKKYAWVIYLPAFWSLWRSKKEIERIIKVMERIGNTIKKLAGSKNK